MEASPHRQTCVVDVYLETDNQHCDCCVKSFYSCILVQISTERRMVELPTKVWVDGTLSPPPKKIGMMLDSTAKQAAISHSKMRKF